MTHRKSRLVILWTLNIISIAGVVWLLTTNIVSPPVSLALIIACLLTSCCSAIQLFRRNEKALISLDHFLPFLRKRLSNGSETSTRWYHAGMESLPIVQLSSNRETGKPAAPRKLLRWLGPSAEFAPLRRVSQLICFALFLFTFFYICWPYHARPADPPELISSLTLKQFQADSGEIQLQSDSPPTVNSDWYLLDESIAATSRVEASVGQFRITAVSNDLLTLYPVDASSDIKWDLLFVASSTFMLSSQPPLDWPNHYTASLQSKEVVEAELFLLIDPLVSFSTALASRSWVWSLSSAAAILLACLLIPRGFCGYICPLGTLIDLFDTVVGKRFKTPDLPTNGWWVHIKYYLLTAVLVSGIMGILISGYVAAIPVITRGLLFIGEPIQTAATRGLHAVVPFNWGHLVSLLLFFGVLCLGLIQPRFWCKYVCPSGAVFSLANAFRLTHRHVESSCIHCNKCIEVCPFDAIKPDYTTRGTDCTLCQTCGGVCPTEAIKFVERWNGIDLKLANEPPTNETRLGRRGFLSLATGTTAAIAGSAAAVIAYGGEDTTPLVRPPGSVPESDFLDLCIRCGECFKACPNNVLHSVGFSHGLKALWTPKVDANWAGCESSCNACGQVCPTGAIRPLPLDEKRHARMGLAIVNQQTCLPLADRDDCQLCVDECSAAGYDAIEFIAVHTETDHRGMPVEGTGRLAPAVIAELCVGCGLCQTRCHNVLVKQQGVLTDSAIIIHAGEPYEDRKHTGSYKPATTPTLVPTSESPKDITDSQDSPF